MTTHELNRRLAQLRAQYAQTNNLMIHLQSQIELSRIPANKQAMRAELQELNRTQLQINRQIADTIHQIKMAESE